MIKRRRLLQVGALGAAALGAAWLLGPRPWQAAPTVPASWGLAGAAPSIVQWNPKARALIKAVAGVILGTVAGDRLEAAVEGVELAVAQLSPAAQREVGELLSLLTLAPTRGLATGVWSDWAEASVQDVTAFLERWRHSRIGLLQSGYHALHDLVLGAWYADPQSWPSIGYAGPPALGR
jgi:hypothetical protein